MTPDEIDRAKREWRELRDYAAESSHWQHKPLLQLTRFGEPPIEFRASYTQLFFETVKTGDTFSNKAARLHVPLYGLNDLLAMAAAEVVRQRAERSGDSESESGYPSVVEIQTLRERRKAGKQTYGYKALGDAFGVSSDTIRRRLGVRDG